jgi:hypothetical protein
MTTPSEAQLARLETIARRLVIGQLEAARGDQEMSTEATTAALVDMLGGTAELDDILQVVWFLSFTAAAGVLAESSGSDDQARITSAIETTRRRINYLARLTQGE